MTIYNLDKIVSVQFKPQKQRKMNFKKFKTLIEIADTKYKVYNEQLNRLSVAAHDTDFIGWLKKQELPALDSFLLNNKACTENDILAVKYNIYEAIQEQEHVSGIVIKIEQKNLTISNTIGSLKLELKYLKYNKPAYLDIVIHMTYHPNSDLNINYIVEQDHLLPF